MKLFVLNQQLGIVSIEKKGLTIVPMLLMPFKIWHQYFLGIAIPIMQNIF